MEPYIALLCAFLLFLVLRAAERRLSSDVPVVGSRLLFGYVTAAKALVKSHRYLDEGYQKYKNRTFQIPGFIVSTYYVSSPEPITEIRKAPEHTLSFWAELEEGQAMRYTFSPTLADNPWHFALIHKALAGSRVDHVLPDIFEEMRFAFDKVLNVPESGGKTVDFYSSFLEILVRINNRMIVGLPLCRDDGYTEYTCKFLEKIAYAALTLAVLPDWIKPVAARALRVHRTVEKGEPYLVPLIQERLDAESKQGLETVDKPDDFIQWLIDAAPPDQKEPRELAVRVLTLNIASTHTITMTFTRIFYDLFTRPEYIAPLREEAATAIKDNGWSKEALEGMIKMDSFFKESMRYRGIGMTSLMRRVKQPMQLSDGTVLPKGASVAANAWSIHHDPDSYPDPEKFDPWRFSRKVEQGESAAHHAFWTASSEYLVWGHGTHVCAGRHFATQVMKATLAYILLNFDFKLPEGAKQPRDAIYLSVSIMPEMKGKIEFSRRSPAQA